MLAHYGVIALPCRVRDPDRKGKVEASIGHAQKTPLTGLRFETLAGAMDAWRPAQSGRPGGPRKFSDVSIMTALMLRLVFRLPLRQTEGFLRSVLALMRTDLEAPDHTTLSRRSQHLDLALDRIPVQRPVHLIVDSTGLSIVGEGEWAAAKHENRGKRGWKKLHFGVDRSGVIIAQRSRSPQPMTRRPASV